MPTRASLYPALNLAQALFLVFWTFLWMPLALVLAIVTRRQDLALTMARRIWAPRLRWAAGVDLRVALTADIDWSRPHVFVMNHQSMLDIVMAFLAIQVNLRFIAKDVLKYVPLLGWYMWATGMIFVKRGSPGTGRRFLAAAAERVAGGASVLFYPEGTRSPDGRIGLFKKGAFALATDAQIPVVPIAIEGSGTCLPRDGFRARPGIIRMRFGRPIPTVGLGRQDVGALTERVRDAVIELHVSIGGRGGGPASNRPVSSEAPALARPSGSRP
jgi:1-acyl-sn-glycerol-3-phosphate acyltransferase